MFLDHKLFYYDPRVIDSLCVTNHDRFIKKAKQLYHESFNTKSSSFFKLSKKKSDQGERWSFKNINTSNAYSNITKYNKSGSKVPDKERLKAFMKSEGRFGLFLFFRQFFEDFVVKKLPSATCLADFSKDPFVAEFLKGFFATQAFTYFTENHCGAGFRALAH